MSVNAAENRYSMTLNDIIKWYKADVGLEREAGGVDRYPVSEKHNNGQIRQKGVLYDGVPMGWAYSYYPNGRLKKKFYLDYDASNNLRGKVRGKVFNYFYYKGNVYAVFGDGENFPIYWLKDGKPFKGLLTLGYPDKRKGAIKGELDSPEGQRGAWFKIYLKNGVASGIAIIRKEKGVFKKGFKNGLFLNREFGHAEDNYRMGKKHGKSTNTEGGVLRKSLNYKNGKLDGWNYRYFSDGSTHIEALMRDGLVVKGTIDDGYGNKEKLTQPMLEENYMY